MKAKGIVRRIEACPIEHKGVKNGFLGGFRKEQNNILNMRQKSIAPSSKN